MKAVKFPLIDSFYDGSFYAAGFSFGLGKLVLPRPSAIFPILCTNLSISFV